MQHSKQLEQVFVQIHSFIAPFYNYERDEVNKTPETRVYLEYT